MKRAAIEAAVATDGAELVAECFALSECALKRHMRDHDRVSGVVLTDAPPTLRCPGVAA